MFLVPKLDLMHIFVMLAFQNIVKKKKKKDHQRFQ